jgi:predicted lipoprotein with Yx(FWY)xxD motif
MKRRHTFILLAALAALAIAVAGCGSGSSNGSGGSSSNAASTSTAPTLYTFAKDSMGKSNCTGECAQEWPPATAGAKTPSGVNKQNLATIKRADGTRQLALGGRPLYTFTGDKQPGDQNGNGLNDFGGVWTAVGSAAKKATAQPSGSYGY